MSGTDNPFGVDNDQLAHIVNFDNRADKAQLEVLKSAGGVEGVAATLRTDLGAGISTSAMMEERRQTFGVNKIPQPPPTPLWRLIFEQFYDRVLQLLLIGALVNVVLGSILKPKDGWIEGVAIFIAVGIVVVVTAGNDYSKELQFRKVLALQQDRQVKVVRNGEQKVISTYDIVVGDIIVLMAGDQIPADGLFVEGKSMMTDEAALTGEPDHFKKDAEHPFLFSGGQVASGSGKMLATAVGANTTGGKIEVLISNGGTAPKDEDEELDDEPKSHEAMTLQEKLEVVAMRIGYFGMVSGMLTVIALVVRWGIDGGYEGGVRESLLELVHFIIIGVTIVVVAVPEGLPLAVTIALAFGMMKMVEEKNFVRKLEASETMGSATCICSDKTGTLTQNVMTVVECHVSGRPVSKNDKSKEECMAIFAQGIASNTTCWLEMVQDENGKETEEKRGNKTEIPLIMFLRELGMDYAELRKREKDGVANVYDFNSARKRMSTLVRTGDKYRLYVKGASEVVLGLCNQQCQEDGTVVPFPDDAKAKTLETIEGLARRGLRTLSFAYRDLTQADVDAIKANVKTAGDGDVNAEAIQMEASLTYLALVGIQDPLRPEVKAAVAKCQGAGLVVRMVTGDNVLTAESIARECGIITPDKKTKDAVMVGPDFRKMSTEARRRAIISMRVLARSSPEDKNILVNDLRAMGEIVAVTGDGTNDAPALKAANVGFAMGIVGTDIAKNASDIVLLDDNFSSIVNAIKWGRGIFDAVRKFIQFQLAVNVVAIIITLIGSVAFGDAPLNAVQLLWVNLIMDTLGALALATEPPSEEVLLRPPNHPAEGVMTRAMMIFVTTQVVYQLIALNLVMFGAHLFFDVREYDYGVDFVDNDDEDLSDNRKILTLLFTVFVVLQMANEFLARHLDHSVNLFKRLTYAPQFLILLVLIAAVQIIVVIFGEDFTGTVSFENRISLLDWVVCVLFGVVMIPFELIVRVIVNTPAIKAWKDMPYVQRMAPRDAEKTNGRAMNIMPSALPGNVSPRENGSEEDSETKPPASVASAWTATNSTSVEAQNHNNANNKANANDAKDATGEKAGKATESPSPSKPTL